MRDSGEYQSVISLENIVGIKKELDGMTGKVNSIVKVALLLFIFFLSFGEEGKKKKQ